MYSAGGAGAAFPHVPAEKKKKKSVLLIIIGGEEGKGGGVNLKFQFSRR